MTGNILVTGTSSGVGRYIHEQLGGQGFTRQSGNIVELKKQSFELIIHCACNSMFTRLVTNENLGQYYYDNTLLTQELLQIPHRYFVFFSTVDVYPLGHELHLEDEVIHADLFRNIYATTKIISEAVVQAQARNFLILRPTTLVGLYMRKNNLIKLLEDSHPSLTLDERSVYNLILYSDILRFILLAIAKKETGIFNLASSNNVTLARIAKVAGKNAVFGAYHYEVGNIVNQKAARIQPRFNKSSEDILNEILTKN